MTFGTFGHAKVHEAHSCYLALFIKHTAAYNNPKLYLGAVIRATKLLPADTASDSRYQKNE